MKKIKIHIIGEKGTRENALKSMAEQVEKVYSGLVKLKVSKHWFDQEKFTLENGMLEKPDNSNNTYLFANELDRMYRPFLKKDYALYLVHMRFCIQRLGGWTWFHEKKNKYLGTAVSRKEGELLNNFIVIKGERSRTSHSNVVMAAHEVFHALSTERKETTYGLMDHCKGFVQEEEGKKEKYCLMNMQWKDQKQSIDRVALDFCEECHKKLNSFYNYNKKRKAVSVQDAALILIKDWIFEDIEKAPSRIEILHSIRKHFGKKQRGKVFLKESYNMSVTRLWVFDEILKSCDIKIKGRKTLGEALNNGRKGLEQVLETNKEIEKEIGLWLEYWDSLMDELYKEADKKDVEKRNEFKEEVSRLKKSEDISRERKRKKKKKLDVQNRDDLRYV